MQTFDPYESETLLAEYLLFHYGASDEILPYPFGPVDALHFPVRCVSECLDVTRLAPEARALDLGCAVGRSSFELARSCSQVLGIDRSRRFIEAARTLAERGSLEYARVDEGCLMTRLLARVPEGVDRSRVRFAVGDAMRLPEGMGRFHLVLMANLLDRLGDPQCCLLRLRDLLLPGGQVVITSPYTWMTDFTPADHWLGGVRRDGRNIRALESLHDLLDHDFELQEIKDLPFLIREHERKYQWCVAQATRWLRRGVRRQKPCTPHTERVPVLATQDVRSVSALQLAHLVSPALTPPAVRHWHEGRSRRAAPRCTPTQGYACRHADRPVLLGRRRLGPRAGRRWLPRPERPDPGLPLPSL